MSVSLFKLFKNSKVASMICQRNDLTNDYDCKLGFDNESNLFKNNGFKYKASYCDNEFNTFIESLGAVDTKKVSDVRRWVVMDDKNNNIDVYSFGGSSEVHIVKVNQN